MKAGEKVLWKKGYVDGTDREVEIIAIYTIEDSIHKEHIGEKLYVVNVGGREVKLPKDELKPIN